MRKYKYLYIDQISEEKQTSPDLVFGTAMHSAIHSALSGLDGTEPFKMIWDSPETKSMSFGRYGWKHLYEVGLTLIEKFSRYLPRLRPVQMEKRLFGSHKGLHLEGTPDFIGEFDGVPTLIDWKTSAYNYDKSKAETSLQLRLYAFLAINNGFRVDQVAFFPFIKSSGVIQTPIIFKIDATSLDISLDELKEYVDALSTLTRYPRNSNACFQWGRGCDFLGKCWGANAEDRKLEHSQ